MLKVPYARATVGVQDMYSWGVTQMGDLGKLEKYGIFLSLRGGDIMRITFIATIMAIHSNLVFADDINFIEKTAEHYNLPPLSDYLQDASSNPHALLEVTKRCSAIFESATWALSHLNGLADDDPQILDNDTMYQDLRQLSFRFHVLAIRDTELNQDTYEESWIMVDPDIYDYTTQYFGRLHRNHDKDATLIENDPLLQDEFFACVGVHEQLREGGKF